MWPPIALPLNWQSNKRKQNQSRRPKARDRASASALRESLARQRDIQAATETEREIEREMGKHELRESSSTLSLSLAPQSTSRLHRTCCVAPPCARRCQGSHAAAWSRCHYRCCSLCSQLLFACYLVPPLHPTQTGGGNLSAFCLWFCFCLCSGQHRGCRWRRRRRRRRRDANGGSTERGITIVAVLTFFSPCSCCFHASCYICSYMRSYMLNPCGEKAAPHTTTQNGKLTARNSQWVSAVRCVSHCTPVVCVCLTELSA